MIHKSKDKPSSQQRAGESGDGLAGGLEVGAVLPSFRRHGDAVAYIAHEIARQLLRHPGVVHDGRHFEIVLEAAYVHVGRTDRTEVVVDNQYLGMVEALAKEIDLDTRIEHFPYIGPRGAVRMA